jgi:hypothetical protein
MKNKTTLLTILAALLITAPMLMGNSRMGEPDYETAERVVMDTYTREFNRQPSRQELFRYVYLVTENNWTPRDLRQQLRRTGPDFTQGPNAGQSFGAYQESRSSSRHSDRDYYQSRRWVESIFEDKVGRLPNRSEMDEYCDLSLSRRYDRSSLERLIVQDYQGVYEPYSNHDDYRYRYDRYSSGDEADLIVREAYLDILGREPDPEGLRNYRSLMIDRGWSERRLREHLANSPEVLWERNSKIVIRAYQDLLDREPSTRELEVAVEQIGQRKWDEKRYRDEVRKSTEYQHTRPRAMIEQAYREVLLRDADAGSFEGLRREILRNNWTLKQVKDHLRKSSEYQNVTIPKMVREAYLEVLKREPDPNGERTYLKRAREGWTFEQIKDHMRKSDEYRNRKP